MDNLHDTIVLTAITAAVTAAITAAVTISINWLKELINLEAKRVFEHDFRKKLSISSLRIMDISRRGGYPEIKTNDTSSFDFWNLFNRGETKEIKTKYMADKENTLIVEFKTKNKGREKLYLHEGFLEEYREFTEIEKNNPPNYDDIETIMYLRDIVLTEKYTNYYHLGEVRRFVSDAMELDANGRFRMYPCIDNESENILSLDEPDTIIKSKDENKDLIALAFGPPGHYTIKMQITHTRSYKRGNREIVKKYIDYQTFHIMVYPYDEKYSSLT